MMLITFNSVLLLLLIMLSYIDDTLMIKKDIPRIELGLLDSKSNVLTITPYVLVIVLAVAAHLWPIGS